MLMAEKIALTWQKGRGLWKKCVGKRMGDDGQAKPMIWWFTDHRAESEELAEMVLYAYGEYVTTPGLAHWTPEAIATVQRGIKRAKEHFVNRVQVARRTLERFGRAMPLPSPADAAEPVVPVAVATPEGETVKKAIAAYIEEMKLRQAAGQISASHVRSQQDRLEFAFKGFQTTKRIAELTDQDVTTLVLRIASLPHRAKGHKQKTHRVQRISVTTAKNSLSTLRWFLVWADETDRWTAPRRLNKLFKQVRFQEAAADDEAEVPHFDLAQLSALWANADGRLRTWIALGLNCAFGSMELATLKRSEIRLGAQPHIARHRQKSNVYAKWALWPETVELLQAHAEKVGDLAFVSESGQPLVVEGLDGRTDSVHKPWARLAKRSGVSGTFKLLRKTAAWMTKQAADLETSEMMLSHTEGAMTGAGKMNRHYAGRDWQKLAATLLVVRNQLLAAGVLKGGPGPNRSGSQAPVGEAA
jgi:integrase